MEKCQNDQKVRKKFLKFEKIEYKNSKANKNIKIRWLKIFFKSVKNRRSLKERESRMRKSTKNVEKAKKNYRRLKRSKFCQKSSKSGKKEFGEKNQGCSKVPKNEKVKKKKISMFKEINKKKFAKIKKKHNVKKLQFHH